MYSKRVIQSGDTLQPAAISKRDDQNVSAGPTPRLDQRRNGEWPESPNLLTVPFGARYNENVSSRIKDGLHADFVPYNNESTVLHPGITRPAQGDIPTHLVMIPRVQKSPVEPKSFNMGIIANLMNTGR